MGTVRRDPWRLRTLAVHLFALSAFAIAQPIFDLLARTPEFLLVRRVDALDVLILVVAVSFGPALVLWLVEVAASALGRLPRVVVHLALVTLLGALCALPAVHRHLATSPARGLALAAGAGVLLTAAYAGFPGLRSFTTWLAPTGVVFPALFLLRPPTSLILAPPAIELAAGGGNDAPIVMIVFDEFPAFALLGADGQIDATLFPNFARLAREGTWFRNATTVASMTPTAVGSILTGVVQGLTPLGTPATKAKNLFTLMGATHELNVRESYAPFCPPSLCREPEGASRLARLRTLAWDTVVVWLQVLAPAAWADRLPTLAYASLLLRPQRAMTRGEHTAELQRGPAKAHWANTPALRSAAFEAFIASIQPSAKPALHYFHVLAPHVPYVFEPSGRVCAEWRRSPPAWWWYGVQQSLVLQQRLLRQVGWIDTMIGRLLAHLERTGLYDRSLLVLVADHGISFRPNAPRRALTQTNACDVLPVPLFVKGPHQRTGGVSDRNVEVIDVLPTMAALLGMTIPWPVDGRSAFEKDGERATKVVVGPLWIEEHQLPWVKGRLGFPSDFGVRCLTRERPNPEVAWGYGPRRVFRLGPYGVLLGRAVRKAEIAPAAGILVTLSGRNPSAPVAAGAAEVPCLIEGEITVPGGSAEALDLVVAINGTIEAIGRSAELRRRHAGGPPGTAGSFSIPVPASAFRDRPNTVQIFVPRRDGDALRLVPTEVLRPGAPRPRRLSG